MKLLCLISVAAALVTGIGLSRASNSVAPVDHDLATKCYVTLSDTTPDQRITACSAIIEANMAGIRDVAEAYLRRANAYYDKKEFELAIADYTKLIQSSPADVLALLERASAYIGKGATDLAFADYARVIEINPKLASPYVQRGDLYVKLGDIDRAITDYKLALQINSRGVHVIGHAHVCLGVAYRLKGKLDDALAECNRALDLDEDDWRGLICRGETFEDQGDFERALTDFTRVAWLKPNEARPHLDLAHVYRHQGQFDRELSELGSVIERDARNPSHYFLRSVTRFRLGQLHEALDDLDRSYELDPKSPYTSLWRDILRKRLGQPGQLAVATKQLDMTKWPAPVVRLFLGEVTVDAVLAAADDPNPNKRKGQVCEANFYAGELALQRRATEEAVRLLRLTANDCPKNFIEWSAAVAELRVLEPNR